MYQNNRKSNDQTQKPWVASILLELQHIQADVGTNRHLLNQLIQTNQGNSGPSVRPHQNVRMAPHHFNVRPSSISQPGPSSNVQPGPSSNFQPNPSSMSRRRILANDIAHRPLPPRACWYHRTFGTATKNCIQPCEFTPPILIPNVAPHAIPQPASRAIPNQSTNFGNCANTTHTSTAHGCCKYNR